MGKRRKRLTMAKYAKKYAKVREALFGKEEQEVPVAKEEPVILKEVIEAPKVEEVVEEIKVETKIVSKPKSKPKKKTSTKAKSTTKKTTAKKSTRKKK